MATRKKWFAADCCIHTNPKVVELAAELKLDIDATVGKLCRLWAWAMLSDNESGQIGKLPASEIAAIMRWNKKPDALLRALVNHRFLDQTEDGGLELHGWYEMNGKSAEKSRRDRERKM